MAVYEAIRNLVQYGVNTGLLQESDRIYATNQILEVLGLDEYEEPHIHILRGVVGAEGHPDGSWEFCWAFFYWQFFLYCSVL